MSTHTATTPFSRRLREATWARHQGVDPTSDGDDGDAPRGILGALLDGELHLADYTAWTAQQYFIYRVIEQATEHWRGDPVAGRFVFDELTRMNAFDSDLSLLIGPEWADRISPLPSTGRYLDRLREVCFDWPGGFVAHHYTRYLGDLSGGQAFRAAANDLYGFADGPGVSFYRFDTLGDLTAFKAEYRSRLDAAPFDDAEQQRVIDEVLLAYDCNERFLTELSTQMRTSV